MATNAVYAGSFDPPTKGHEDVIVRASKMFNKLYVLVADNPAKKPFWGEDPRARMSMLRTLVKENHLDNVEVASTSGLTVDFAKKVKAGALVRGCRNSKDFEYEADLAYNNKLLNPDLETVILFTKPEFQNISSTTVRQYLTLFQETKNLSPEEYDRIMQKLVPESLQVLFASEFIERHV